MGRAGDPDSGEPLVPTGPYVYQRSRKDTVWGFLFLMAYFGVIAVGVYAFFNVNPEFARLDREYLSDPGHCPYPGHGRRLGEEVASKAEFDVLQFFSQTASWLGCSIAASLVLGWLFLGAFRRHAATMTGATIVAQIVAPLLAGVGLLVAGQALPSIGPFVLAGLSAFVFYLWRDQIALASNMLSVAAHGLAANPHLITTSILLNVTSLVALAPLLAGGAVSFLNGGVVPNPARGELRACVSAETGEDVLCCAWATADWVQPYMACALVVAVWSMLVANQVRVFVVSGTVAQWYFAPASAAPAATTRGTTLRALGHALGPSFGSLSLAGLVLTAVEAVRSMADRAAQDSEASVLTWIATCLVQCIGSIIEYLTKFATVFMAITGDAFVTAGRRVTALLARNLLDAFASTVWFTPMVIQLASLSLAVVWGALSGGAYYLVNRSHAHLPGTNSVGVSAAVLGALVGVASLFVLNYLGGVLLAVLDATFVCWAIDKDNHTVSHPEVYDAFAAVPLPGAVIEQPGGGMAYGALGAAPQQQAMHGAPRP